MRAMSLFSKIPWNARSQYYWTGQGQHLFVGLERCPLLGSVRLLSDDRKEAEADMKASLRHIAPCTSHSFSFDHRRLPP